MKVKVYVSTRYVGSKSEDIIEIDDEEWADMSDREKDEVMQEAMFDLIEWGYEEA